MERFRGGLVLKAHRLAYHSALGSGVIKKMEDLETGDGTFMAEGCLLAAFLVVWP